MGLLEPAADTDGVLDKLSVDHETVRRLISRPGGWACYQAGPTGEELASVLRRRGCIARRSPRR